MTASPEPADGPKRRTPSDIATGGWIERRAPGRARPYLRLARLDRPIGTWLLLFPCWWGVALASGGGLPDPGLLILFALGSVVMRAAGCVINDFADRDFDRRVARTALRPLASGTIGTAGGLAFLAGLLLAGLLVLTQFNWTTVWLGLAATPLIVAYPFMKRITYWPQAWLGITFNWGALVGYSAVADALAPAAGVLYAGAFFWTLGYDTIYAHQDKEDDALIGVKSTALKFGPRTKSWLALFYALAVALMAAAGALAGLGLAFYAGLGLAALQLLWQVRGLDIDDPLDCLMRFKSNRWVGLLVFLALVAGRLTGAP
ncbi:MAG: 4-hydroxybenzoate octaprenyltransferase [Proteobacteria bacterium]|nr:4-hydroxybenzoate octaprenyltransferase [Pseudomonadota bacterium]